MTPDDFPAEAALLVNLCRRVGERGWCDATSGNFSLRVDDERCLLTQSGRHKARLRNADLMLCTLDGTPLDPECRPSAETPLHACLYALDEDIGAVLHTHSVTTTVLSRAVDEAISLDGFEMQKALTGIVTHEAGIDIPVFENEQDMRSLAGKVRDAWQAGRLTVPGFVIRGHGLYAWGRDGLEAERHLEGFEFLFACRWQELLAGQQ